MKKRAIRITSIILTLCMVLTVLPLQSALAADTPASMQLGMGGISAASTTQVGTTPVTYAESIDYIFMGERGGSPVLWRVLDTKSNGTSNGSGRGYLLMTEYVYDDNLSGLSDAQKAQWLNDGVIWDGSPQKAWAESFYNEVFSSGEQAVILTTDKTETGEVSNSFQGFWHPQSLSGEKVFFLSHKEYDSYWLGNIDRDYDGITQLGEVKQNAWAYSADDTSALRAWWMRSHGSNSGGAKYLMFALESGYGFIFNGLSPIGGRPAMNIDPDEVVMIAPASGKPSALIAEDSSVPAAVGTNASREWKLTLRDESLNATVSATRDGDKATVSYSGAPTGDDIYISVVITDATGKTLLNYSKLATGSAAGSVTFTLPDSFDSGEQLLYAFCEQDNGENATDYAGDMTLVLASSQYPVEGDAPDVDSVSDVSCTAGVALSLTAPSCTSASPVLSEGWQVSSNGTAWTNYTAGTPAKLSWTKYRYYAANIYGTGYSNEGTLTVSDVLPTVGNITAPAAINKGAALSLTAPTVSSLGSAVTASGWQLSADGLGDWTSYTVGDTLTYDYNGYTLRYFATNGEGTAYSNSVVITVLDNSAALESLKIGSATVNTAGDISKWSSAGWKYELTDAREQLVMLNYAGGADITAGGNLTIATAGTNRVGKITSTGDLSIIGTGIFIIDELAVDGDFSFSGAAVFVGDGEGNHILLSDAVLQDKHTLPTGVNLTIPTDKSLTLLSELNSTPSNSGITIPAGTRLLVGGTLKLNRTKVNASGGKSDIYRGFIDVYGSLEIYGSVKTDGRITVYESGRLDCFGSGVIEKQSSYDSVYLKPYIKLSGTNGGKLNVSDVDIRITSVNSGSGSTGLQNGSFNVNGGAAVIIDSCGKTGNRQAAHVIDSITSDGDFGVYDYVSERPDSLTVRGSVTAAGTITFYSGTMSVQNGITANALNMQGGLIVANAGSSAYAIDAPSVSVKWATLSALGGISGSVTTDGTFNEVITAAEMTPKTTTDISHYQVVYNVKPSYSNAIAADNGSSSLIETEPLSSVTYNHAGGVTANGLFSAMGSGWNGVIQVLGRDDDGTLRVWTYARTTYYYYAPSETPANVYSISAYAITNVNDLSAGATELNSTSSSTGSGVLGGSSTSSLCSVGVHSYGSWTVTKPSTCVAGTQVRDCTTCDAQVFQNVAATGSHSYSSSTLESATCTNEGRSQKVCSNSGCGVTTYAVIAKLAHSYGGWTVTKQAEIGVEGSQTRSCSVCGASETAAIPALKDDGSTGGNGGFVDNAQAGGNTTVTVDDGLLTISVEDGVVSAAVRDDVLPELLLELEALPDGSTMILPLTVGNAGDASVTSVSLTLPKELVEAAKNGVTLVVDTSIGQVVLTPEVLGSLNLPAGDTAVITLGIATDSDLGSAQLDAIGDRPALKLQLVSSASGKTLDYSGVISVRFSYELRSGELSSGVEVSFVSAAGEMTSMATRHLGGSSFEFDTPHNSIYVIGYNEELAWENPFRDVLGTHWFFGAVRYSHKAGILRGVEEDIFSPDSEMTRAMFITAIYRLSERKAPEGSFGFSDIPAGEWFTEAVEWGAANGIAMGDDGSFRPYDSITRQEVVVILNRYLTWSEIELAKAGNPQFADLDDSSFWAIDSMRWAAETGILNGDDEGRLNPHDTSTRAQIAQIFYNLSRLQA